MAADIIVSFVILAFCVWGIRTGFINGLLSFVTIFVGIVLSVLIARPLAGLLNRWFGWADSMAGWFSEGGLDGIARNNGILMLTVFVAIFFFILIMVGVFLLRRFVKRLRQTNRTFNKWDSVAGFFFGFIRFMMLACILSVGILLLDNMGTGIHNWLFGNSTVAVWIYDRCVNIISPMLRAIQAAITG